MCRRVNLNFIKGHVFDDFCFVQPKIPKNSSILKISQCKFDRNKNWSSKQLNWIPVLIWNKRCFDVLFESTWKIEKFGEKLCTFSSGIEKILWKKKYRLLFIRGLLKLETPETPFSPPPQLAGQFKMRY